MSQRLRFVFSCAASCQLAARRLSQWFIAELSILEDVSPPRASRTFPFGKLFVRYFDWLRGGQEEEEEVLIDTVKVAAFSFSRATLCAMRSDRPGPALAIFQHPV